MKRITQKLDVVNNTTPDGKPDGGLYTVNVSSSDIGNVLRIVWQQGPLVVDGQEVPPNGLFLETAVRACIARLEYYQTTQFKSRENAIALTHLETALLWLGARAQRREDEGTLGTHEPDKNR
jgi:hypothetical protein